MGARQNERTADHIRMLIVAGWTETGVMAAPGADSRTVRKWRGHYAVRGGVLPGRSGDRPSPWQAGFH